LECRGIASREVADYERAWQDARVHSGGYYTPR
jgi:hypothetical protein